MEEKYCNRCGKEISEESNLCKECDTLIDKAVNLIQTNDEVAKFYEEVEEEQKRAKIVLDKLRYKYNNLENQSRGASLLKTAGRGLKKAYKFNILEAGINSTKKIFQGRKVNDEEQSLATEEEMLIDKIAELEDFIETDPIELVIFQFIYTDEEKGIEKTEKEEERKNFLIEPVKHFAKEKFYRMDKNLQFKIGIVLIVILSIIFVVISLI
ncbi:hypothetical protein F6Y05_38170 [Bacillus megaterium]|nr:hypothetical protein [Priestia megaterium]